MRRSPTDGKPHPRLFPAERFEGFGPSGFRPPGDPVTGRRLRGRKPAALKRGVSDHAPKAPGVYGMLDGRGRVVYIGKAKCLRARLLSYFRVNSRDPKAGRILEHTRVLVWEESADEFAALLRELELIQRFTPRFNVLGQPGAQRYHYLCLGRGPAPYVYVARAPAGKDLGCYGPLVKRARSEEAARKLNDWFGLRDCPSTVPMVFADQAELFPDDRAAKCLRFEIGTCAGPCAGRCSRKDYGAAVRAAKALLDGRDRTALGRMREQMAAAAADFQFEKAMAMRDRLAAFEWLDDRLSLLRRARDRESFVYPLAGPNGREVWYLIARGQVRAVTRPPESADDRERVAALVAKALSDVPAPAVLTGGAVDSVLLVAAWFRKFPAEKAKLLTKPLVLAKCAV